MEEIENQIKLLNEKVKELKESSLKGDIWITQRKGAEF